MKYEMVIMHFPPRAVYLIYKAVKKAVQTALHGGEDPYNVQSEEKIPLTAEPGKSNTSRDLQFKVFCVHQVS